MRSVTPSSVVGQLGGPGSEAETLFASRFCEEVGRREVVIAALVRLDAITRVKVSPKEGALENTYGRQRT